MLELVESDRLAQLVSGEAQEEVSPTSVKVANELGYRLRQGILESGMGEYTQLEGYWIADVRNEGDLSVDSVAINLPGAVVAVTIPAGATIFSGEAKQVSVDSGVVPLGTLRPNGKIRVIAWTGREPSDFFT